MIEPKVIKPQLITIRTPLGQYAIDLENKKKKFAAYRKMMDTPVTGIVHYGEHVEKDYFRMDLKAYAGCVMERYCIPYGVFISVPKKVADRLKQEFSFHEYRPDKTTLEAEGIQGFEAAKATVNTILKGKEISRVKMTS